MTNEVRTYAITGSEKDGDYYYESAWWCAQDNTEYDKYGEEVPKIVSKPRFLTEVQLQNAREERNALIAIGAARTYLGKKVIEWSKRSPNDPRIPEALFIASKANAPYRYACGSDEETAQVAESILRDKYPNSPWTAKLEDNRYDQ